MQFLVTSKKAIEVISVLTLFKPFGGLVWAATCAMIASQTTFLFIIRKVVKSFQIFEKIGSDFKGMSNLAKFQGIYLPFRLFTAFITDIALPLALLLQEARPISWLRKEIFSTRLALIGQWLICLMFLSHGYRCILLSMLVPIQYSKVRERLEACNYEWN